MDQFTVSNVCAYVCDSLLLSNVFLTVSLRKLRCYSAEWVKIYFILIESMFLWVLKKIFVVIYCGLIMELTFVT